MHAKAYVLIEAESGKVAEVINILKAVEGITAADAVTGPYDIIAVIETPDPRDVGRLVIHEVHPVDGVKRTVTCLTIG
jgi:DNA-binding Lrp family transcriptional regulator